MPLYLSVRIIANSKISNNGNWILMNPGSRVCKPLWCQLQVLFLRSEDFKCKGWALLAPIYGWIYIYVVRVAAGIGDYYGSCKLAIWSKVARRYDLIRTKITIMNNCLTNNTACHKALITLLFLVTSKRLYFWTF